MTSRATVRRAGARTAGPSGFEVTAWTDVLTDVPFRLAGSSRGGSGTRTVRVGETEVQVATREAHFPAGTVGIKDRDLILVTAGENAGLVLRVVEAAWADQQTALRVPVVEDQRPAEWV